LISFAYIIKPISGIQFRPARPQTLHGCHHDTKVKPEAATAVVELLIIGGRTPETCWAVNNRQDNELKNYCIWLVIYLNCTMMHGLTNLKFTISRISLLRSFMLHSRKKEFYLLVNNL